MIVDKAPKRDPFHRTVLLPINAGSVQFRHDVQTKIMRITEKWNCENRDKLGEKTVKSKSRSNSILMDSIIKEVNLAYDVLESKNADKIDVALFAEEHIHSVIDLFSNKDLSEALQMLVLLEGEDYVQHQEFYSSIQTENCIDDMFSILYGSDVRFSSCLTE